MARYDIHTDASYGEVNTTDNLTNKVVYDFALLDHVDGMDNDRYCYGEITAPPSILKKIDRAEIRIRLPYRPIYKILRVRLRIDYPSGDMEYMINESTNKIWYEVVILSDNGDQQVIRLSEYHRLNPEGVFNLVFCKGQASIYSGHDTDFVIQPALQQNEVYLLKAFAGNLYQHPTTGVGLIDFLHGNFENSGLAVKLQSEFENDLMVVNNAYMDSESGELLLDVTERNG